MSLIQILTTQTQTLNKSDVDLHEFTCFVDFVHAVPFLLRCYIVIEDPFVANAVKINSF